MRRAERLFRLVQELRARGVTRARDVAAVLEISPRTVYRDIAHLQASGLPIEGAAGVGYLLRPGFDLPSVTFTHPQLDALAVGLAFAEGIDDPDLAAAAREVRAKLQAALPGPDQRRLADAPYFSLHRSPGDADVALRLREAIRARRRVALGYRDGQGALSDRRVRPLAIWSFPGGWMVSGWCELRQGFRSFRFDRIASLCVTPEAFADEPGKNLDAFLAQERCRAPAPPQPTA